MWGVLLLVTLAHFSRAEDEPVSGKLYVFGKVGLDAEPVELEGPHAEVLLDDDFRAVAAAPNALAVISVDSPEEGTIWRLDDPGPLGTLNSMVPNKNQWCQVCKGVMHTVAIQCNGEAFMWGPLSKFPSNDPDGPVQQGIVPVSIWSSSRIIQASCGQNHTILLTEERDVLVVGETSFDRLGIANLGLKLNTNTLHIPVKLPSLSVGSLLGDDAVCFVAAGAKSSFAVTERGDMYVWGANEQGQLGVGSTSHSVPIPTLVDIPDFRACEIAASDEYTIAYDADGRFWSWGGGVPVPTKFGTNNSTRNWFQELDSRPIQLAAGQFHSAFLLANGSVFTVGYNRQQQLGIQLPQVVPVGDGGQGEPDSPIWTLFPRHVEYLDDKNISSIFANGNFTVAHAFMPTPMNCGCNSRRHPTRFGIPGSKPYLVPTVPLPRAKRQDLPASNVFGPVAPNKMKPRLSLKPPVPGEVVSGVTPATMQTLPAIHQVSAAANNFNKKPELAPTVAKFVFYPKESEESKLFKVGKERYARSVFGKFVSDTGYLYGDDANTTTLPIPQQSGMSLMPDFDLAAERLRWLAARNRKSNDTHTFSLSLQDVKKPVTDDMDIIIARQTTTKDLKDRFGPVDFEEIAKVAHPDLDAPPSEPDSTTKEEAAVDLE